MKKLIFLLFLLPSSLFAQVEYWYGVDLSRLGYRHNVITLENAPNGQASAFQDNPFREIRGASWEFSSEVMNKHVYFGINGSYLLDIGTALFQYKEKDRWYKNSEYRLERGELFPVQLAFGSNIGKYFALYAGGQYQYTTFGINYNSKVSEFRNVYIGGNQRGAGVHAIFAKGMFFARYSYMHDWIRAAKEFTGMAYTHEFVLHFGPQKFGAFMKLNYVYWKKRETKSNDAKSDGKNKRLAKELALQPEKTAKRKGLIAIYLHLLFSSKVFNLLA